MKHLGLFFGFFGGIALLFMVPRLISQDTEVDTAAMAESHARLDQLEQALRDDATSRKALAATLQSLVLRIGSMEGRLARQPIQEPIATPKPVATPKPAETQATDANSPEGEKVSPAQFKVLLTKVLRSAMDGTATTAEQERFWKAARTTGLVNDTIASLETYVKTNPQDNSARMELGDAYVAKLLTVPGGPERGIWGMKAEKQWKDVVKQDPDHWDAQYTLAYNYSMYPDFLNKTDDAIAGFEQTLRIQERAQPKSQHAKTYVQLARMHGKKGNTNKAREVLELGQMRHPRDKEIAAALRALRDS
jgi:tetratricopeptide (TPR) repeat protein